MKAQQQLQQLGLHKNEAAVYMALLTLGYTQAGQIVKNTKLHRMLVYNALNTLNDKGLVTVTQKKNIKHFQAADPNILADHAHRLLTMATDLIPSLRQLQETHGQLVQVRTLVGVEGFVTNLQDVVESAAKQKNKQVRIIGGAKDTDFYTTIGEWYPAYLSLSKKYHIKKRLLAPQSFSTEFKKKFASEPHTELRTLPTGLSSPSYTRMTEELVSIEIYHPSITIIQIRNNIIAQGYIDSFELLWKMAI